jgi:hypothetical protein
MLLLVLRLQGGRLQRVPNGGLYDVGYGIKKIPSHKLARYVSLGVTISTCYYRAMRQTFGIGMPNFR